MKYFIIALLLAFLSFETFSQQPNVLIIIADDQGWGDLGFTGNKTAHTPNLDKLAKSGTILDRFYVSPVCSPTRAEILTGRYHVRTGVSGTSTGRVRLDLDETTIAEAFKHNGYQTALFGKWHNGGQAPYHPNCRGIDEFYGFCSGHWGNYFNPILEHNGEVLKGKGFMTDDLTDHAIEYINKQQDQPFFMIMALNTPHSPMQVPDAFWNRYNNKPIQQKGSVPEKEDIQHTRAALALNENIDENIGRVIATLEKNNQLNNTIIIYFSDNGPNGNRYNGGMKGIKGSTDEGGVRVPFIISWKNNIKNGRTLPQIAANIDLFPTLIELAGLHWKNPKPFDGISLKNILMDKNPSMPNRIIPSFWANETSVRSQKFRLSNKDELYDMVNDPNQTKNVATEFPSEYRELKSWKDKWLQDVRTELPAQDLRPLMVGNKKMPLTNLPAAEGEPKGNIIRSSKHPNDSYFLGWKSSADKITWNVEVEDDGVFEVSVFYACSEKNIGTELEMKFNDASISKTISTPNNVPVMGMENDKVERDESYVKDFKPMKLGNVELKKGKGLLELSSKNLLAADDLECNMISLKRVSK
ncbi:MAG: arylsulfatase [Bacteroidota bacterium]|jgi:arylsulfatase A-like enzyme|nr:arylsulfatase [Chitinophagaceae bacterium]